MVSIHRFPWCCLGLQTVASKISRSSLFGGVRTSTVSFAIFLYTIFGFSANCLFICFALIFCCLFLICAARASVCMDVFSEVRLLSEFFSTFFTFIIPNTSVCKDVLREGTLVSESFYTFFTFIIPNISVCKWNNCTLDQHSTVKSLTWN